MKYTVVCSTPVPSSISQYWIIDQTGAIVFTASPEIDQVMQCYRFLKQAGIPDPAKVPFKTGGLIH